MPQKPTRSRSAAVALAVPLLLAGQAGFAANDNPGQGFAEGRILVKPAAGLSDAKLDRILARVGARARQKLTGMNIRVVDVPAQAEAALARALNHTPGIAFAEVDLLLEPVATVNDPNYPSQWHLPRMQAPDAWQYGDGSGVKVAVCDSGVYAGHPDLAGQVLDGWNTVSNNTDTSDIYGHGTKVAGTIAAATNNLVGVASAAPGAKILPVRVTNSSDGVAYSSDIAECIQWAADQGARVANVSFAAAGSAAVANAASYMLSRGGVVTVSAGNYNSDAGYANSPYLFVVAATDSTDGRAGYSSFGNDVDIAAPGSGIYTTTASGGYGSVSGTSFSSPLTAAAAALVMATNPSLNPTDVTAILVGTAVDLGSAGWDPYFGYGRVNALAAVQLAASAGTSDLIAPKVSIEAPLADQRLSGDVMVLVRATDAFGVVDVGLYVDDHRLASETQATANGYPFVWDSATVADGQHRISARATDAAGNVGRSATVYVTVTNVGDQTPPSAFVTSPSDGATVGGNVTLSGYATDDQGVEQFRLLVNGALKCAGTSSASCGWNTRKLTGGSYTVTAEAVDGTGNTGSASVTVFLDGGSSKGGPKDGSTGGPSSGGKGNGRNK
ncbi:MAG: S8 family serine peptidase [Chromatiaceae bacterium]|nr:S8 family serine peptidase [Chromatiaceae bacterium]MCP5422188.1 S8 family serine peptidase [Chromatiaceae bacterium]